MDVLILAGNRFQLKCIIIVDRAAVVHGCKHDHASQASHKQTDFGKSAEDCHADQGETCTQAQELVMEVRSALYRQFTGQGGGEKRSQNNRVGYAGTAADPLSFVIGNQGQDEIGAQRTEQVWLFSGIDLPQIHPSGVFYLQLFHDWSGGSKRSAPVCPEVHHYQAMVAPQAFNKFLI